MTKEEAIKQLKYCKSIHNGSFGNALKIAIKALEQEPKTGNWIGIDEEPHEDYECNICGYVVSTYTANIEPHTEYKYCPNCGAKMVKQQESEDKECI